MSGSQEIVNSATKGVDSLFGIAPVVTALVLFIFILLFVVWQMAKELKAVNAKFIELAINSNEVLTKLEIAVSAAIRH